MAAEAAANPRATADLRFSCGRKIACQLHTHARCRSERAVSYESHVSESSGSPEQHDLVRLGASSLHTGCANRHSRYGEPGCARLVVEEPPERDGGNVTLDDVTADLRCMAGRHIGGHAEPCLHRLQISRLGGCHG